MSDNPLLSGLRPTHPGEMLREDIIPALGMPKTEIARRLGVSRGMLYLLLDEKAPVTPAMALRLGRLLGVSAESWLNMQRDYDLRTLRTAMAKELEAIKPVAA